MYMTGHTTQPCPSCALSTAAVTPEDYTHRILRTSCQNPISLVLEIVGYVLEAIGL